MVWERICRVLFIVSEMSISFVPHSRTHTHIHTAESQASVICSGAADEMVVSSFYLHRWSSPILLSKSSSWWVRANSQVIYNRSINRISHRIISRTVIPVVVFLSVKYHLWVSTCRKVAAQHLVDSYRGIMNLTISSRVIQLTLRAYRALQRSTTRTGVRAFSRPATPWLHGFKAYIVALRLICW